MFRNFLIANIKISEDGRSDLFIFYFRFKSIRTVKIYIRMMSQVNIFNIKKWIESNIFIASIPK